MVSLLLYLMLLQTRLSLTQVGICQEPHGTCVSLVQATKIPEQQLPERCTAEMMPMMVCAEPLSKDSCTPSGNIVYSAVMICVDPKN